MTKTAPLVRSVGWLGVSFGDAVAVEGVKERRQPWAFVVHVRHPLCGEESLEVSGGRAEEARGRVFVRSQSISLVGESTRFRRSDRWLRLRSSSWWRTSRHERLATLTTVRMARR